MTDRNLKLIATVHLLPRTEWAFAHKIGVGYWCNLFFSGRHFPAKIVESDADIEPGTDGKVGLVMIDSPIEPSAIEIGSSFELREGPIVAARCRVVSVNEIFE